MSDSDDDSDEEIEYPSDSGDEEDIQANNESSSEHPYSLSSAAAENEMTPGSSGGSEMVTPFKVMSMNEALNYRTALISKLIEFGMNEEVVIGLLSKHNWVIHDAMSEAISLMDKEQDNKRSKNDGSSSSSLYCLVCCEDIDESNVLKCGHGCCDECWEGYLNTAMANRAEQVVNQTCPYSDGKKSCPQRIPSMLFNKYLKGETLNIFTGRIYSDFVLHNNSMSFCPKPTCNRAIFAEPSQALDLYDVTCSCGEFFCILCGEKAHHPLSCEKTALWFKKEVSDGENSLYMSSHTKPCPKCNTPLGMHVCTNTCPENCKEKSRPALGGCNHFSCRCGHQFCWMCMRPWASHSSATGGYYQCNIYSNNEADEDVVQAKESERERLRIQRDLRRYEFHYTRYQQHKDGVKSNPELVALVKKSVDQLVFTLDSFLGSGGEAHVIFLLEAALLLKDARHVLMWSYAFAYFLPQNHSTRQILEQQQGDLEKYTNHVHSELVSFCDKPCQSEITKFNAGDTSILRQWDFKSELTTYYLTLKQFLENIKLQIFEWEESITMKTELKRELSTGSNSEDIAGWLCLSCTFYNTHVAHMSKCEICSTERPV